MKSMNRKVESLQILLPCQCNLEAFEMEENPSFCLGIMLFSNSHAQVTCISTRFFLHNMKLPIVNMSSLF